MEILLSILIGALTGALACVALRAHRPPVSTTLAVGILGSLVGLSTDKWIGASGATPFPFCEYVATTAGALLALLMWGVAQRLFLGKAQPLVRE